MQSFSTSDIPPRSRVEFWNEVAADALARMEIQPRRAGEFAGTLCSDQLGPLVVCRAISTAATVRRQRTQIRQSTERAFLINLSDQGAFTVSQRGRNATLFEGDFTINDTAEPFAFVHHSTCEAVVLRVPASLMKSHIPVPEELVGLAVSGQKGMGALASDLLRSLCRQMERGLCPEMEPASADIVMEAVASACRKQLGARIAPTRALGLRRTAIQKFIESNLREPELSPGMLARAFRISDRYLRSVFGADDEPVSAYILRRRLEEGAKRLRDPLWKAQTVSQIAFACGFSSLGSFDRAFKSRYAVTPREFRRLGGGVG